MGKAKVSVIVPCYNRISFIGSCLDSLIEQSYGIENLELVLIDDRSTDGTREVINEYEKRFPESVLAVYLTESSGGHVGMVRNIGLSYVGGEYITFVDSDDICMPELVEKLVQAIEREDADCAGCGAVLWNKGEILRRYECPSKAFDMSVTTQRKVYLLTEGTKCSVWARLYRRDFIEREAISFHKSLRKAEDVQFHFAAMAHANKIACISDYLYLYRESEESIVRRRNLPAYFMDTFYAASEAVTEVEKTERFPETEKEWEYLYYVRGVVETIAVLYQYHMDESSRADHIKHILQKAREQKPDLLQNEYVRSANDDLGKMMIQLMHKYGFDE